MLHLSPSPSPIIPLPPYSRPELTALDYLADAAMLGAGIGIILFWVAYALLFRWHATPAGIAVFTFTGALAAVFILIIASRFSGGDYEGRDLLRFVVYVANLVAAWGMFAVLVWGWLRGNKPLELHERESVKRTTGPNTMPPTHRHG